MLPFELVATATDSPKYSPAGSLRKLGTEVKGISATPVIVAFCWATAGPATRTTAVHAEARYRFMSALSPVGLELPILALSVRRVRFSVSGLRGVNYFRGRSTTTISAGEGLAKGRDFGQGRWRRT